jgi:actin-related protein
MLEEDAQAQTVVMVNGSGNNYCGFAGEQFPLYTKQNLFYYEAKVAPEEHPILLTDNSATQTSRYKAHVVYKIMKTL